MKRVIITLFMFIIFSSPVQAGFWDGIASGLVVQGLTGGKKGVAPATATDNSKAYFIVLNKKVKGLELQVNVLMAINAIAIGLAIFMFIRQRRFNKSLQFIIDEKPNQNHKGEQ